jgi:SecA DEAD-like domain
MICPIYSQQLKYHVILWWILSNVRMGYSFQLHGQQLHTRLRNFQTQFRNYEEPTTRTDLFEFSSNTQTISNSRSNLKMGMMEDFLSGADATKREADNQRYLTELQQRVERINALEASIEDLGDDELEARTIAFRQRLQQDGEDINGPILEEAFAVVREAAWYVHPYSVFLSFFGNFRSRMSLTVATLINVSLGAF